ncbi:hypothetical protein AXF42_Ash006383 [Apostasia shenzhenica]|uniref:Myb-like domain-containing protein n=1 Tax=Apostasia shenzhenica TaxID=1088818 RepID=A0A2I0AYZ2_9ASPA|nr:hypothetical protein AXF42_Ash006383 [Apostasia shenzhenica]
MASAASSSSTAADDGATSLSPTSRSPSPPPFPSAPSLPPPPSTSSRRLPPPCWTHEETLNLIDAYREIWFSLGRRNLRAPHWDDVASAVARRSPSASGGPKTSVQCRHKIEKLRRRFRSEKLRSLSSWLYFRKMDAMERCAASSPPANGRASGSALQFTIPKAVRSKIVSSRFSQPSARVSVKPGLETMRRSVAEKKTRMKREEEVEEGCGFGQMATAMRMLGDSFLRMEQMKIDMAKEMEKVKMEMELKRTEVMIDCQRQIMEAMIESFVGKKRGKTSPQC